MEYNQDNNNFTPSDLNIQKNSYGTPDEIKKWNWGAFMFNIFWGVGNKSYLPLLCLIPLFNIVWVFVCGAKGNKWAWENGNYSDVQRFLKIQQTWNRAGLAAFLITLIIIVVIWVMFGIGFSSLMLMINPQNF